MAKSSGPSAGERFYNGMFPENPVFRQILGICPTLAVTNNMKGAMTMVGAVAFVLICANVLTSTIRHLLRPHLRILMFTLTIATFVTIADRFLAAFLWSMSKELGPYVPLIIVNCVIIARCEVCGAKQPIRIAAADAVGQAIGFGLALASIATVREVLGFGTWFDVPVAEWVFKPINSLAGLMGAEQAIVWPNWTVMVLPPGAFIALGVLMGAVNWAVASARYRKRLAEAKAHPALAAATVK